MLWIGGHIIVVGLKKFGWGEPAALLHDLAVAAGSALPALEAVVDWLVQTLGSAFVGVVIEGILVAALHLLPRKSNH
jgi:predicted DNA repair protein MutK